MNYALLEPSTSPAINIIQKPIFRWFTQHDRLRYRHHRIALRTSQAFSKVIYHDPGERWRRQLPSMCQQISLPNSGVAGG
jgi:hypothetical protein